MTHYSPSQLRTFQTCNLRWRYRYIDKITTRMSPAAAAGRAVHAGIEANLRGKMLGIPLDEAAAVTVATDSLKASWPEVEVIGEIGETTDKVARLSRLHHQMVAPKIEPLALEERIEITPPGRDYSLVMVADIRERGLIRDTKTTSKSPSKDASTRGPDADQLTAYSMAFGEAAVQLDYLVDTKTPAVVSMRSERTADDHARLLEKFDGMHRQIQAGVFLPAPGDSWACSEKWCGWWKICPHGGKR